MGVLELLVAILSRIVRGDLIEKMRFKQRNEGCEGVNCTDIWRKIFRQREQPKQRKASRCEHADVLKNSRKTSVAGSE